MKTSARIGFIFVIGLLLAACVPQATALSTPVPTATLTPTVSSTPLPTATPTLTPEPSPTPLPAYAEWMEAYVEGLVPVTENGITYLVNNLPDGRSIKVFECVNGEWQPSYEDMDKFVRANKTFDYEAAQKTMIMRMGKVADVDGQPAMSVNMEDYKRFAAKAQQIWDGLTGLKPAEFNFTPGGRAFSLTTGREFEIHIMNSVGEWQLIGWAKNPIGNETVFVLATADGPVVLLDVGNIDYTFSAGNIDSIEEVLKQIATKTSTQTGTQTIVIFLFDTSPNPRFEGTVNMVSVEKIWAYIRGMGINSDKIAGMMYGNIAAQRNALKYMLEHFPAPVYDACSNW